MGKALTERLRAEFPGAHLRALGTNALATSAMLRAGADDGATGENALVFNLRLAELIVGPVGMLMPNGLLGEVTVSMAQAVGDSAAPKVLLPSSSCGIHLALDREPSMQQSLGSCIAKVRSLLAGYELTRGAAASLTCI
ncbi:hypothetical protein SDC9_142956 [bioreactor metagenome]|uniref:Uncharacterized protein n=1 Tax=bioreactor metagenome TaxID=1076179 RepID=A0A645E2M3_9ZZZZ